MSKVTSSGQVVVDVDSLVKRIGKQKLKPSKQYDLRDDLDWLLLCALRYSMGRRTYAASLTSDLVRKYWSQLSDNGRHNIARDLKHEIDRHNEYPDDKWLGDQCDVEEWFRLDEWIETKGAP